MEDMKRITADLPQNRIPQWAHLQRRLIDTMNAAVDPVVEKYLHPDGRFMWPPDETDFRSIDGLDDAYESFHSWPLFYLLGGHEKFLSLSHREYDVVTEQFGHYATGHGHPMVVKEYEQGYDWMHQGEGYQFFYLLNLADPGNTKNRERAIRYAGFYLNEDPEIEPNYDPERKMLKCCYLGSMGPAYRNFTGEPWTYADWKQHYGLPFHDVEGVVTVEDLKDERKALKMGLAMRERMSHGDTAVNLFSSSMVMNAYLHTGDRKYRDWINEYTGAWRRRAAENGGLIPDNVGPNGIVGECMGGRWYGGYYGWTWPHGFPYVMEPVIAAAQNGCLLNRTDDMEWPRELLRLMMGRGIERDGTLHVPQKYADPGSVQEYRASDRFLLDPEAKMVTGREDFDVLLVIDGWFEFQPVPGLFPAHILQVSRDPADLETAKELRNHKTDSYRRINHFYAKNQGGHDDAWLNYLDGGYPSYPEEILEHNIFQVYDRMKIMREDTQDPATYGDAYLQQRNPITCEGLTQLTMGGPLPIYNGGLLQVSVRYFDAEKKRPGLPEDTAALVSKITGDGLELTLVNTIPVERREMIVQSGAFGEHGFTEVMYGPPGAVGSRLRIDDRCFKVAMLPGTVLDVKVGMRRFCNDPSYRQPWS